VHILKRRMFVFMRCGFSRRRVSNSGQVGRWIVETSKKSRTACSIYGKVFLIGGLAAAGDIIPNKEWYAGREVASRD